MINRSKNGLMSKTVNFKKVISPQDKDAKTLTRSSSSTHGNIPEKWFNILIQLEVPGENRGEMFEIVSRFIDSQVVMKDNDTEMQAAIDLVENHARFNCLERLQSGEYVPLSIVEDFGKRFVYNIISSGKIHTFHLKHVRVMLKGNPEDYIGRLTDKFDPMLLEMSKDSKQLLWEIGVIFRKGGGQGKRKRETFYRPDKDDKRIMLSYYWDYRKNIDKVVTVGLFQNRKVRIIAEQPPEKFSSYAFSFFGDVPIKQAKKIVAKVNLAMNLFKNAKPRFPEIYFDRENSLLIITNNALTYDIRVKRGGGVEVEKIRLREVSRRWENFTKIINYSRYEGIRRSRKKANSPIFR